MVAFSLRGALFLLNVHLHQLIRLSFPVLDNWDVSGHDFSMLFIGNQSEDTIAMSQRRSPRLELLTTSHVFPAWVEGLRTRLTWGGQSCGTGPHASLPKHLDTAVPAARNHVGLLLRWKSNTFSFCCHQMGWQRIEPSLTERGCQILSVSWYAFLLVSASFTKFFSPWYRVPLHYFFQSCERPNCGQYIQVKSLLVWLHNGYYVYLCISSCLA